MSKYTKPEFEVKEIVAIENINSGYGDWASDEGLSNGVTTFNAASSQV